MQRFRFILFALMVAFYAQPVFGVTPEQFFDNISWLMDLSQEEKLYRKIESLFFTVKKRDESLDLRSLVKKKIRTRLSRMRGLLPPDSRSYEITLAAWSLVKHYALVDQRWCLQQKEPAINDNCSVCILEPENSMMLLCGHQICAPCLLQWFAKKPLKTQGAHHQCPLCRIDIGPNLKSFLKIHSQYPVILESNRLGDEQEDHRTHMDEQAGLDQLFIEQELFSADELEALIRLQQEFDARSAQRENQSNDVPLLLEEDYQSQDADSDSQEEDDV